MSHIWPPVILIESWTWSSSASPSRLPIYLMASAVSLLWDLTSPSCVHACWVTSVVSNSFETLWNYSLPGSSVHGISQARILEWVVLPSSRGPSQPRDWTHVSFIVSEFSTSGPLGKPLTPLSCLIIPCPHLCSPISDQPQTSINSYTSVP